MDGKSDYKPRVVVMFCQNAAENAAGIGDAVRKGEGFTARLVVLPCSSKIEIMHLIKVLQKGEDGIEVVGCPPDKCRLQGESAKAAGRVNFLKTKLRELNLNPERVGMTYATGLSRDGLMKIAAACAARVREFGPNPQAAAPSGEEDERPRACEAPLQAAAAR